MLDLQQLRYFVTVAEYENVGRAAAALNITQSPLSRQIQALEGRLGLQLFFREKQRIRLTPAGRSFLGEARTLLAHAAGAERRARAMAAGTGGVIAIAYVEGALLSGAHVQALRAFRSQAPEAEILFDPMRSDAQFAALESGEIDIGFTYRAPPAGSTLASCAILREAFRLVVPIGDPGRYTAHALDGAPFIAPPAAANESARYELLSACARAGFTPDIRHEAAGPLSAIAMVAAGLGFAFAQHSLAPILPSNVLMIDPPDGFDLEMRIHAVWRADCSALASRFVAGLG